MRVQTLAAADLLNCRHMQEFDPAEVKAVFRDTGFPLLDAYLEFIGGWLDSSKFEGEGWACVHPQTSWDAYIWQLDVFRQKALLEEQKLGITPEQEPLYGKFDVSPKGRTLCLQREKAAPACCLRCSAAAGDQQSL